MSKKKNKSGYVKNGNAFSFSGGAKSAGNAKKITKSQASGSTVETGKKKHLNITGENAKPKREKLGPVDKALERSVKADNRFINRMGARVEHAQRREDFRNNHVGGSLKENVGNALSAASALASDLTANHRARVERRNTAMRDARKAARRVWNTYYEPNARQKLGQQATSH